MKSSMQLEMLNRYTSRALVMADFATHQTQNNTVQKQEKQGVILEA